MTIIITAHNPNQALALESNSCFFKTRGNGCFWKSSDIIQDGLLHEIYGNDVSLDQGKKDASIAFVMDLVRK